MYLNVILYTVNVITAATRSTSVQKQNIGIYYHRPPAPFHTELLNRGKIRLTVYK